MKQHKIQQVLKEILTRSDDVNIIKQTILDELIKPVGDFDEKDDCTFILLEFKYLDQEKIAIEA